MTKQRERTKARRPNAHSPRPAPPVQQHRMSEDEQIEAILTLWETPGVAIADIARAIGIASRDLIALLKRPDIRALLDDLTDLLELRSRHTALRFDQGRRDPRSRAGRSRTGLAQHPGHGRRHPRRTTGNHKAQPAPPRRVRRAQPPPKHAGR
ncbi:MAG: hypothetical protein ACFHWZ_07840 [Phycisphaerales bacterium]